MRGNIVDWNQVDTWRPASVRFGWSNILSNQVDYFSFGTGVRIINCFTASLFNPIDISSWHGRNQLVLSRYKWRWWRFETCTAATRQHTVEAYPIVGCLLEIVIVQVAEDFETNWSILVCLCVLVCSGGSDGKGRLFFPYRSSSRRRCVKMER